MRLLTLILSTICLALSAGCGTSDPSPGRASKGTWAPVPYGTPQLTSFSAVRFASAKVGWVIGGYVPDQYDTSTLLTTRDGGMTWIRTNLRPQTLNGFRALFPVSEQVVFAVAVDPLAAAPNQPGPIGPANGRAVYKSTDGGANWQKLPGTGFADSFQLYFFDEQHGLSFKNQAIQQTTDGGASWQQVSAPLDGSWDQVRFPTTSVGYVGGGSVSGGIIGGLMSRGCLAKTTNKGDTWASLPWPYQYISSLSFVNANVGFAATYPDQHLYKTQNGGLTWKLVNSHMPVSSNGHFLNEKEGYFAGDQTIQHTADGGISWQEIYRVTPNSRYPASINSLHFPTAAAGFAVTADGQIIKGTR